MNKENLKTLKTNLSFMKKHLKNPAEFPALVEAVARLAAEFKQEQTKTETPDKKRIQALKRALKKITDSDREALAIKLEPAGFVSEIKYCGLNSAFDHIEGLRLQCAIALDVIRGKENHAQAVFFIRIAEVYESFTGKAPTYNHTTAFIKFCTEAYSFTGNFAGEAAVRDKVRKYVYETIIGEPEPGESVNLNFICHPKA